MRPPRTSKKPLALQFPEPTLVIRESLRETTGSPSGRNFWRRKRNSTLQSQALLRDPAPRSMGTAFLHRGPEKQPAAVSPLIDERNAPRGGAARGALCAWRDVPISALDRAPFRMTAMDVSGLSKTAHLLRIGRLRGQQFKNDQNLPFVRCAIFPKPQTSRNKSSPVLKSELS
jgi:hypothetical protein